MILLFTLITGLVYYSSNQAIIFLQDLSKYTQTNQARKLPRSGNGRNRWGTPRSQRGQIKTGAPFEHQLGRDPDPRLRLGLAGPAGCVVRAFLVYFMLSWQHHVRSATVMLFSLENRNTAYITLGLISAMIRSFMVGNLLIGLFLGTVSTIAFAILHVPFFYFVGFISGFLSLVPYLGVVLAMGPPIFVSLGHMNSGDAVVIMMTVLGCTWSRSTCSIPSSWATGCN